MKNLYTLHDGRMRLIGIPLLSVLIPAVIHFENFMEFNIVFLYNVLISGLITIALWEGNRFIIVKMRRLFPDYSQTNRRLLTEAMLALVYTFVVTLILDEILCKVFLNSEGTMLGFKISIIPTLLVYLVYEAVYFFEAWQANVRKTESLMREGVQSQLEVLKNQLDPHFLFNSMNTLAALIDDDNTDAQDYLERLSDVYRYVLVSRNKNTVLVEEELAFVDAYVYLNKIRFRDNMLVEKELSSATYQQHVTPLSLQMLIENAIKHNVASKENPLKITIREDNNYLVIANNILEKTVLEKSTRVGLQNIINRYSLLTERRVEISRSDNLFSVKIPLLPQLA
ncbi:histidine kinase [Dyadobacter chenwenxiniae]|uniref:Histidine kinase n=1 Tax=Dyadobacter chenwenxiniae TaxID=2906456 RepID=A0A9X1PMW0_9BACT|nr:histidine kinase [Dyadobacter chenwenxiniae]MCF0062909.1 histidine kinase [Dyadobacter chenwenxiniae]UON84917.1 histidine kinase [Dyadobacter chenwenxiniae]